MPVLLLNREKREDICYNDIFGGSLVKSSTMLSEHLGFEGSFSRVEIFSNFRSNCLVEKRGYEVLDRGGIDAVIATSEYDLLRAARLREYAGLPGQNVESALAFRDKVVMKDRARAVVEVPAAYKRLATARDVHEFVEANGWPLVLKPVDGAGSLNTTVLDGYASLAHALDGLDVQGYELETFVPGQMYVVDGLVLDGELTICWTSRYIDDCLSFKEGRAASLAQLDSTDPLNDRLLAFCTALLGAMPTPRTTTFHLEVFHTVGDRLVLCEIASRTGGGAINELGKQRFGVDMHTIWIKSQAGQRNLLADVTLGASDEIYGFAQVPPKPGRCAVLPEQLPFDFVVHYRVELETSRIGSTARESSDKLATFVVRGDCSETVSGRLSDVLRWIDGHCFL